MLLTWFVKVFNKYLLWPFITIKPLICTHIHYLAVCHIGHSNKGWQVEASTPLHV